VSTSSRLARDARWHPKEWTWKPRDAWSDAVASWKGIDTVAVDYTAAGTQARSRVERRLDDPTWVRVTPP
jgi:hypothetical protein